MVALIRRGVAARLADTWVDLGAGTGNFTWALAELLGSAGSIVAVDWDARALRAMHARLAEAPPAAAVHPRQADAAAPLGLPPLDGALMANLLHFVDQEGLLRRVAEQLQPGGRLLVVEYDLRSRCPGCRTRFPRPTSWPRSVPRGRRARAGGARRGAALAIRAGDVRHGGGSAGGSCVIHRLSIRTSTRGAWWT